MKIKTGFSQKAVGHLEPNFVCKLLGTRKLKFNDMMLTKMATMPIYGKSPSKIFFSRTIGPISMKWYVASETPAHHSLFKC